MESDTNSRYSVRIDLNYRTPAGVRELVGVGKRKKPTELVSEVFSVQRKSFLFNNTT